MKASNCIIESSNGYEQRRCFKSSRGVRYEYWQFDDREWGRWKSEVLSKGEANERIKSLRRIGWKLIAYNPVTVQKETPRWVEKQSAALFRAAKITVDPKKELMFVELDGDRVLGAVYVGVSNYTGTWRMSFDAVVSPEVQGRGVGKALIKQFDDHYESTKTLYRKKYGPGFFAEVFIVNPRVERILAPLGYRYGGGSRDHEDGVWMYKD